jgi:radical SAM superfamily enzyme YgiQ (UPF0313 family)
LLLDALSRFQPDLVGFSVTSSALELAAEATARVRQALNVPVIWGGCGATLERERSLQHADLLCINEGEDVIVELAQRIDRGAALTDVPGTWARVGNSVAKNPDRSLTSLDTIAVPDFEPSRTLHIDDDHVEASMRPPTFWDTYMIMTSRGCPFSCSFCVESIYQDMFGKKGSLRRRSVDLVIKELVDATARFGFRAVQFFDDVFTTHRTWLKEFASRYAAEVGLPFWCYTYPTTTRREDVWMLREAGCASMTMGIQSGSERLLKEHFGRPTSLKTVLEAANIITEAGIALYIDLITKVDFETEDDLRANVELLLRLPPSVRVTGFGHMVKFPNYVYSQEVARTGARPVVSDELYTYYHQLYFVALSRLPYAMKRALIADPLYRRHPELLDRLMSTETLTLSLIDADAKLGAQRRGRVDMSTAQAVVPEEFLDATGSSKRRLSVLA